MDKKMLCILFAFLVPASMLTARGESLDGLSEIMARLEAGRDVRVIFYYARCTMLVDGQAARKGPDAVGGMLIDTFEYFAPGSIGNREAFLSTSETVLINHPRRGLVYNYVKVKVFQSGEVSILAQYIQPVDFKVVMSETFTTSVGRGAVFRGR